MKKSDISIAIIGGGPAAVSVCENIINDFEKQEIVPNLIIHIFEKSGNVGSGLPYSTLADSHKLNLPIDIMGSGFNSGLTFRAWLESSTDYDFKSEYPPRYYFGHYLQFLLSVIVKKAEKIGIRIKFHSYSEVIDIERHHNIYSVSFKNSGRVASMYAEIVLLCCGHIPSSEYVEFDKYRNYYHNPWQSDIFDQINPDASIGILGTRLTAIDAVLRLRENGHRGRITMFSRSGLLPAVLAKNLSPYRLKHFLPENFKSQMKTRSNKNGLDLLQELFILEMAKVSRHQIADLFSLYPKNMLAQLGQSPTAETISYFTRQVTPLEWLRFEIKTAETNEKKWQDILFAIYNCIPEMWILLSDQEKIKFYRNYSSFFMTYMAPFPLDNAYILEDMLLSEQLDVKGGLKELVPIHNNTFSIATDSMVYCVDVLINATGSGHDASNLPLYRAMTDRGLLKKDPVGGLAVNPKTLQTQNTEGIENELLFVVGEFTKGSYFATTDLIKLTEQIKNVTQQIVKKIIPKNSSIPVLKHDLEKTYDPHRRCSCRDQIFNSTGLNHKYMPSSKKKFISQTYRFSQSCVLPQRTKSPYFVVNSVGIINYKTREKRSSNINHFLWPAAKLIIR